MPEKKLKELKNRREPLLQQFEKNPNQVSLALEIKTIDDQIAECNRLIEQKRKTRRLSSPGHDKTSLDKPGSR